MRETRSYRTLCEQSAHLRTVEKRKQRNQPVIDKLAWLTFKEGQLLCARSHGKALYYIPGGKREPGERRGRPGARDSGGAGGQPQTRDPAPRLRVQRPGRRQAARGASQAALLHREADGSPTASAEIAELRWLDSRHLSEVSPVSRLLFQWLAEQGLIR